MRHSRPHKILYKYDLRWPLDDLRWLWKYHQKIWLEMVIIPTKFQVHMKAYANMTSDDPWMTSDDLENIVRIFGLNWPLYPPSFKFIQKFILRWPLMTPEWPWKYRQKIDLYLVIVPTKFHDHRTLNTNRTPKSVKNMQISYLICILCDIFGWNSFPVWALPLTKYHKCRVYHSQKNVLHQKWINCAN